ncbi:MAG TPA: TlpA disulfide reductase family protein [Spirochaetia bacterium]|nr:TlpA disulfide reductase family protein [Spirochaetia bacterium]
MKRFLLTLCGIMALGASAYATDLGTLIDKAGLQPLKPGTKLIDFSLDNLQGKTVSLSSFKGSVVVLNFWATWCGPCRSEMPSLETLYTTYKDKGLVVVGVNLQEGSAAVQQYVKNEGLTFPVLLDSSGRVGLTYGARSIPTTYIIDKQGDVTSGGIGAREWLTPDTEALINALLSQ